MVPLLGLFTTCYGFIGSNKVNALGARVLTLFEPFYFGFKHSHLFQFEPRAGGEKRKDTGGFELYEMLPFLLCFIISMKCWPIAVFIMIFPKRILSTRNL